MSSYQSKYQELKFYVDGELFAFSGGSFSTTDAKVIAVLDNLADTVKVEEKQPEETPAKPKTTTKKAPAKSSAK